ncbi:transcriptional repressor [Pendulispora rubella]|uniref:Ferric uptake regulation protein n=1 Tax=Pendulispora rubella TaxID=2741070 RepID=A0ABZ2L7S4_9BACT
MDVTRRKATKGRPKGGDVTRAIEKFRDVLHGRALKLSTVREAIVRAALTYDGHFNVEDLLRVLKNQGVSQAHLATVYRAIPLLIEAGIIQPTMLSRSHGNYYEAAFEREHHDHLVCKVCGRVIEFHSEAMEALQREIAARHHFEIEEHVHELLGRCKTCRKS